MKSVASVYALAGIALAQLSACSREPGGAPAIPAASGAPSAAAAPSAPVEQAGPLRPAFDFPRVELLAKVGDFALAPTPHAVALALSPDAGAHAALYSGARIERIGPERSSLRYLTQQRAEVPNAFVIPIRRGETARPGEIVLTSWASGAGLQRAMVVSGGEPATPKVRYLDIPLDAPTGFGTEEDSLPPDTFHVLRAPGEVGSSAACRLDDRVERLIITQRAGQRWLGLGFAGVLRAVDAAACKALRLMPDVAPGARAFVPMLGRYVEGKTVRAEPGIGRVWVRVAFGSETRESAFAAPDVAIDLP